MGWNDDQLLNASLSVFNNAVNAYAVAGTNKRDRQFSREMYDRQRADALTDWEMQNSYNSPAAQMARLKAAGLNPNLVYGDGNATASASSVRSSNIPTPKSEAPKIDLSGVQQSLFTGLDMQVKQAQINQLKAATDLSTQQALNVIANTAKTNVDTSQGKLNLDNAMKTQGIYLEQQGANLQKTIADTKYTLDQNDRQAALQGSNIQQALENILTSRQNRNKSSADIDLIRQTIDNMKKQGILNDLDIQLKNKGIQPHDPAYMRVISQLIGDPKTAFQKVKSWLDKIKSGTMNW